MSYVPETHLQYAQRVGAPRVVECDIDLGPNGSFSFSPGTGRVPITYRPRWTCRTHDYGFNERDRMLDYVPGHPPRHGPGRLNDRCPMSRLEEWRARRWAA